MREALSVSDEVGQHPAWFRLNNQLQWYDKKSATKQRRYKTIKVTQLVLASSIPVLALVGVAWGTVITAVLGAGVAMLEGIQQLGQYHDLWINYRSTAGYLEQEKYLFLARSGPYRGLGSDDALRLLAERVEERVSKEHAEWMSGSEQSAQQKHG